MNSARKLRRFSAALLTCVFLSASLPGLAASTTLRLGSRGTAVLQLQQALNALGYDTNGADGKFGKGTERAVKAYQQANGLTADDVKVTLELPESYVLGSDPEVYAVYTVHGGEKQESTSVRVDAEISGLPELLENSTGQELEAAKAVKPQSHAFWLLGISLGSTAAAALVTFLVVRFITWRKKRRRTRTEQGQTRRGK